jgi:hypothetical protein
MPSKIGTGGWLEGLLRSKLSPMVKIVYDETFEEQRNKWAVEIGRFVLAFGSIETLTYSALRHCPRDPIGQPLIDANLGLQPRIDLLIALAASRGLVPWVAFVEVLREIKQLASKRNLIAHNGVGYDVYVDPEGGVHVEEAVRSGRLAPDKFRKKTSKEKVVFQELEKLRVQAEALEARLSTVLINVFVALQEERQEPTIHASDQL